MRGSKHIANKLISQQHCMATMHASSASSIKCSPSTRELKCEFIYIPYLDDIQHASHLRKDEHAMAFLL